MKRGMQGKGSGGSVKGGNAVKREWWKCEGGGMQGKGSGGSVKGGNAVEREWGKSRIIFLGK